MKNKKKLKLLLLLAGLILFSKFGITSAINLQAENFEYYHPMVTNTANNVSAAILELYSLAEKCKAVNVNCPLGYGCEKSITPEELGGTKEMIEGQTYYGILYLDPRKSGNGYTSQTNCSSSKFTSNTGTIEGCMRFYIYNEDENYYYAILDHNTTRSVSGGFSEAHEQVLSDTKYWAEELHPRNIKADEVYKITESTNNQNNWTMNDGNNFYFNSKNGENGQGYGWLFDRTYNCTDYGCTTADNNELASTIWGYWTSDVKASTSSWLVINRGMIGTNNVVDNTIGVRPVIQIAK